MAAVMRLGLPLWVLLVYAGMETPVCRASSHATGHIIVSEVFGFNNVIRSKAWTPVSIVLENRGGPIHDGLLELTVTRGDEFRKDIYHTRYTTRIELPAGSKKMFRFQVFVQSGLHPVAVTLYHGRETVFRKSVSIRRSVTEKNILAIAQKDVSHDLLEAVSDRFTPAVVHARHLPHQWQGYQGVGALVLSAQILPRLEPSQVTALLRWIESGGTLVSYGSMNTSLFSSDTVKKVLQVAVHGVEKIDPVPGIPTFCNVPEEITGGLWVNRTRMQGARVLASQGGVPLILSKPMKDGCILFLSFDAAGASFVKWKGNPRFWQTLLSHAPVPAPFPNLLDDGTVLDLLMENSQKIFPTFWTMAAFLGVYLAAMAWLLKPPAKDRQNKILHLSALGLVIILFSGLGLGLFLKRTDYTAQICITRVTDNRARMARDIYTGIYTPHTLKKRFDAGIDPIQILFPPEQERQTWLDNAIFSDRGRQSLDLALGRYDVFHYKTRQVLESRFKARVTHSSRGLVLALANLSGTPIVNSFFYDGDTVFFIGEIPADTTMTHLLEAPVPGFAAGEATEGIARLKRLLARDHRHDIALADGMLAALFSGIRSLPDKGAAMTLAGSYNPKEDCLPPGAGWLLWQVSVPEAPAPAKKGTQG